jgi:nitroreductase/NAD-dependent dihydropyrimidine dehydrogenase PreA subunit
MSLFVVDQKLCLRDDICIAECPRFLLETKRPDAFPTPIDGADGLCIDCGHCVTACPTGALTHRAMSPTDCPEVREELLPGPEQVDQLLKARRSIRTFEARPVPGELLGRLIDVGRYAPTGSNRQTVEWLVIQDSTEVRRLARMVEVSMQSPSTSASEARTLAIAKSRGLDRICRGAPHVIVALTPKGHEGNGMIALSYLEVAAFSLGLGACWGGFFTGAVNSWPPLREALRIPDDRSAAGSMLIGYPKYRYARVPRRKEARVAWR